MRFSRFHIPVTSPNALTSDMPAQKKQFKSASWAPALPLRDLVAVRYRTPVTAFPPNTLPLWNRYPQ
jgi:hypothetical protein